MTLVCQCANVSTGLLLDYQRNADSAAGLVTTPWAALLRTRAKILGKEKGFFFLKSVQTGSRAPPPQPPIH